LAAVVPSYNQQPVYYPLEAATNIESCRAFYQINGEQAPGVAIDARYANTTSSDTTLPNEFDIQLLSQVYETLTNMPLYS